MDAAKFVKDAKNLIKVTRKHTWTDTMNLLLVALGVRNLYYMDSDDVFFTSYAKQYQAAVLKLCETANMTLILFNNGRWAVHNSTISGVNLSTDAGLGKALGFPCSASAMDLNKDTNKKLGVNFHIITEHGDVVVTSFLCFKREKRAIMAWFETKKTGLELLKSLHIFTNIQPQLVIESYSKTRTGSINIDSIEKYN